jgi:hypothetical protein
MPRDYDIRLIGAGHNWLALARYLSRAGQSVLSLERPDLYGECMRCGSLMRSFRRLFRFGLPDAFDHAVLVGGGFLGASLILGPEPAQCSFQLGKTRRLAFGHPSHSPSRAKAL